MNKLLLLISITPLIILIILGLFKFIKMAFTDKLFEGKERVIIAIPLFFMITLIASFIYTLIECLKAR